MTLTLIEKLALGEVCVRWPPACEEVSPEAEGYAQLQDVTSSALKTVPENSSLCVTITVKCRHGLLRIKYIRLRIEIPYIIINTWQYVNLLQIQMGADCFILITQYFLKRVRTRVWRQNFWSSRKGPNQYQKEQLNTLGRRLTTYATYDRPQLRPQKYEK
jgi:hypothetical protein